jgi:Tfp pilus assembly protein PilO
MSAPDTGERRTDFKASLLERLHDPLQLRICVIVVVVLVGYGAVYQPLTSRIAETTKKLKRAEQLVALARSIEHLQTQYQVFQDRLPKQTDSKEWVQYVLEGIRRFPLRLSRFDCREPKQLGPYGVIVLQIELEGSFLHMDQFLRWLESNQRLFRADDVRVSRARKNSDVLLMQLTVLGMTS